MENTKQSQNHNTEKIQALEINLMCEKNVSTIIDYFRKIGLTAACYAYKYRVKGKEELLEKVKRKITEKPEYKITDITDAIGVRFVTLFKGEMVLVYQTLIEKLASPDQGSQISSAPPEEIIVYKGLSAAVELQNTIRDITKKHFKNTEVRTQNSQEHYSSIHIICRHTQENELTDHTQKYQIPIEIQIRTVFEDAWGEIDHKFGYTNRRAEKHGKPETANIDNIGQVKSHLKTLKDFCDACMNYAENIKISATTENTHTNQSRPISVESDEDILARLTSLGASAEFIEGYTQARKVREAATNSTENQTPPSETSQAFIAAASQFENLKKTICTEPEITHLSLGQKLSYYYCAMNQALCLVSTKSPECIASAIEIYYFLEENFPSYPLVKMRLGQALGNAGKIDSAIEKLTESGLLLETLSATSIKHNHWSDELPKADYTHMIYTQPKILGFTIWQKIQAEQEMPPEEKSKLFKKAHEITLPCLEQREHLNTKQTKDILNNLLYYSTAFIFYSNDKQKADEMKNEARKYLNDFMKTISPNREMTLAEMDTVFKAHAIIGDKHEAKKMADQILSNCLNTQERKGLGPVEFVISGTALHYIQKGTILAL